MQVRVGSRGEVILRVDNAERGEAMGLFGKSEARKQEKRIGALLATALKSVPTTDGEQSAEYQSAIDALRTEGPAAEEFMLAVASGGLPFPQNLDVWQVIFDMGESVVPGVVHVMRSSPDDSARAQAVMVLGTFAQTASPAVRQACLQEVRHAAENGDDPLLHSTAEAQLKVLANHGIA